jgi:PAS domain S-box-containing protein
VTTPNNQPDPSDNLPGLARPNRLAWLLRYGLAVAAVGAGLGFRQVLTVWVGPGLPASITFYPAVMVVALLGGFGPGVAATALASLASAYWILPPAGFSVSAPTDRLGLVVFTGMGVFMSGVAELYRRRRHKAAAYDREAALRESEARLSAFAEATFEGIVESDAGRVVDCNEQLARMLGYSVAELIGLEIASLIAPEDRDRVIANIRESRESAIEHVMLRKDGTRIVVEVHGRPVSPGSARRHTAIRDITARKRTEAALRESEARYRGLFNTIDAGFCIIEMIFEAQGSPVDYRFLVVNAAFEKQTGLHDAQGKLMRELAPAHEAHWFEVYGRIAITGEAEHFVNEARALGRWYDVYAYRVGAPESRQVAILFNDITAHKQAEAELRLRAEELRAANEELTRFNRVTVGRELRIIELKKQVNELCARLGQPPRYAAELDEQVQPMP